MVKEPYTMCNKVTNERHIDETDPDRFYYIGARRFLELARATAYLKEISESIEGLVEAIKKN